MPVGGITAYIPRNHHVGCILHALMPPVPVCACANVCRFRPVSSRPRLQGRDRASGGQCPRKAYRPVRRESSSGCPVVRLARLQKVWRARKCPPLSGRKHAVPSHDIRTSHRSPGPSVPAIRAALPRPLAAILEQRLRRGIPALGCAVRALEESTSSCGTGSRDRGPRSWPPA